MTKESYHPMRDWQPIETAPEGVRVLVYMPDLNKVSEAWYSANTKLWPRDREFNEDGEACNLGYPSHWMPLPEPPKLEDTYE